jgi:hypothetical protein
MQMVDDAPLVPQFRDLVIPGGEPKFDELAAAVEQRLLPPWSRDRETQESPTLQLSDYRVFQRDDSAAGPGLLLFLIARDNDVEVANVVPTGERRELTKEEYNDAVEQFSDGFLASAAETLGLVVRMSPSELDLRDVLDERTYRALLAFSRTSNRSTGSSHPMDRERWFEFLVSAYRSRADLSTSDLESWLVLDGWSEDVAWDLLVQFEFAMGLLKHVDRS